MCRSSFEKDSLDIKKRVYQFNRSAFCEHEMNRFRHFRYWSKNQQQSNKSKQEWTRVTYIKCTCREEIHTLRTVCVYEVAKWTNKSYWIEFFIFGWKCGHTTNRHTHTNHINRSIVWSKNEIIKFKSEYSDHSCQCVQLLFSVY